MTSLRITERTGSRGNRLYCRAWSPEIPSPKIQGMVFISHGFSEHLGFYENLGTVLASRGLLAFGHDHNGHGNSCGTRAYVETVDHYVDDVIEHCKSFKKLHPNLPLHIIGHSMGGMIALRAAINYPEFFDGMVLQGPLIIPGPSFKSFDARITPIKSLIAKMFLGPLDMVHPELIIGSMMLELITRDDDMKDAIQTDDLRWKSGCKVRLLMAFVDCLRENMSLMRGLTTPFLVLHGTGDKLCNPVGSEMLYREAMSEDKELILYEKAAHQLYLEVKEVRDESIRDTVNWILQRSL